MADWVVVGIMVSPKPGSGQSTPRAQESDPLVDSGGEGKFITKRVVLWVVAYMVAAFVPIGVAVVGPLPPPRPFLVEFGVGVGFLAIAILALEFVTSGRFRRIAPVFGADVVLQFHRQMGVVGFVLVLAHPILLIASDPDYLDFFDPRVNLLRALALSAVIPAVILLLVTSLWREPIGLQYEWWRLLHGSLALLVVFIGMVHGIQVGHYLDGPLRQGLWVGVLSAAMYLVIHTRVVRPWLMRRRPYVIAAVRPEAADVTTIELTPENHDGMTFQAGQYAWVTLGDRPHSMQQHPFSFVSSESGERIAFSAKQEGDFTSAWQDMPVGSKAFLEGPYGAFTLDRCAAGAVLIVGGIGVTPAMSILRTLNDRKDPRPMVLIYATPSCDDVAFGAEIDELEAQLEGLSVVHVPERPPEGWPGKSGYVDRDILDDCLGEAELGLEFFICGPEPMMDMVETALRELGVPRSRIYTERFQIV